VAIYGPDGLPVRREYALPSQRETGRGFRGVTGIEGYGGYLRDPAEYSATWTDLRTRLARVTVMRSCGYVTAGLAIRTLPIVRGELTFTPPETEDDEATDEEKFAADWLYSVFVADAYTPMAQVLRWKCEALADGFSVVEGTFRRERWRGRTLVRPWRWEHRRPRSIADASERWTWDPDSGALSEIRQGWQQSPDGRSADVMLARNCLVYSHQSSGATDVEGHSELRACDRAEQMLADCVLFNMMAIERFGSPTLWAEITDGEAVKYAADAMDAVTRIKSNHRGGAWSPPGVTIKPLSVSDGDRVSGDTMIGRAVDELAMALKVPALRLGQSGESSGSRALGATLDMTTADVVEADADAVAAALQWQMVEPLVRENFGANLRTPRASIGGVKPALISMTLDTFERAAKLGIKISEADEDHVRKLTGMPARVVPDISTEPAPSVPPAAPPVESIAEFDATPDPEWQPRRALKAWESTINFAAINATEDAAEDALTKALAPLTAEALTAINAATKRAVDAGDVDAVDRIATPEAIRERMVAEAAKVLRGVRKAGVKSAQSEVKLSVQLAADDSPADASNAAKLVTGQARRAVAAILGPLEETARQGALQALSSGKVLAGAAAEALGALASRLSERAASAIASSAQGAVPTAFGLGRRSVVEASEQEFRQYWSALLDTNTCPACIAAEDYSERNVVVAGTPEAEAYFAPLRPSEFSEGCASLGGGVGNKCRCINVWEPL
jgi:hypothetical protein